MVASSFGIETFSMLSPSGCAIALVLLSGTWFVSRRLGDHQRLPPGPPPLPFIGNVHQVPKEYPERTFARWSAKYGDIVRVKMFSQDMIILSSLEAARDLLDKKSSLYSDRPRFVLFSELMGWSLATTHLRYGPRFRRHRRWMNHIMNAHTINEFRPLQTRETLTLLKGLMQDPDRFLDHFKRYAAATVLKVAYGRNIESVDDELIEMVDKAGTATVESGSPAAILVDFFPIMRHIPTWLPLAGFKRKALESREVIERMFNVPYEAVKADVKAGTAEPSYVSALIERAMGKDGSIAPVDEQDIKGTAGSMFTAAEDTTVSVLHTFIMVMVLHPLVYKKLQAEMDSVTGQTRLPNFSDRPSLPYLECVLKEMLRWNVPVPLGMPHRLIEDDAYRNYFLPAGSSFLVNIYAIMKDCDRPDEFIPERYLEDSDLPDPRTIVFGFGRRICPGRYFSEESLWSIIANIVATMDIDKALDENGVSITPKVEFTTGFVSHPQHFKCVIKPRSANVWNLVEQTKPGDYVFPIGNESGFKM